MTPPITNGLFAEPGMELIERDGELLGPLLPTLFLDRPSIEQRRLLSVACQPSHAERHGSESNPPTHTLLKEGHHHVG